MTAGRSLVDARETGTRVTACDIASGESETQQIVNDYVIVTDGKCRVEHVQVFANGTHMITVRGVERG